MQSPFFRFAIVLALIASVAASHAARAEDAAADDDEGRPPALTVPELKGPAPKIDGALDDEAWKTAATGDNFRLKEGSKAQSKTKIYVTRDATTLYVAVECFDDEAGLKALKGAIGQHNQDGIWGDDCVELFIDPTGKRETYYQFIVNFKAVTWEAFYAMPGSVDKTWNPDIKAAAKVNKDSWTVEVAFPIAVFDRSDKSNAEWAFNVTRTRPMSGEGTFWSPVYNESTHHPEKFGILEKHARAGTQEMMNDE